jgi:hypothetical protein
MLTGEARYSYSPIEGIARFGSATFEGGTTGRVVGEILLLRKQGYPYDVIWDSVALSDLWFKRV